jgi:hypothetical protein
MKSRVVSESWLPLIQNEEEEGENEQEEPEETKELE